MCDSCSDNRFEIIDAAKQYIIDNTNIESSPDEMKVLDDILFRLWQLRLLEPFNPLNKESQWQKYSNDNLPPIGEEVIAYRSDWVDPDFNPTGTRVGFRTDDNDFVSAYWWDYHDDYIAIANWKCNSSPEFFVNHINKTIPEYWIKIKQFKDNHKIN